MSSRRTTRLPRLLPAIVMCCCYIPSMVAVTGSDNKVPPLDVFEGIACFKGFDPLEIYREYYASITQYNSIHAEAKTTRVVKWKAECGTFKVPMGRWSVDGQKWKSSTGAQEHCVNGMISRHFSDRAKRKTIPSDTKAFEQNCNTAAQELLKVLTDELDNASNSWKPKRVGFSLSGLFDHKFRNTGILIGSRDATSDEDCAVNRHLGPQITWKDGSTSSFRFTLLFKCIAINYQSIPKSFVPPSYCDTCDDAANTDGQCNDVGNADLVVIKKSLKEGHNRVTLGVRVADGAYELGLYQQGDLDQPTDEKNNYEYNPSENIQVGKTKRTIQEMIAHAREYSANDSANKQNSFGDFVKDMCKYAGVPYPKFDALK